VAAEMGEIAFPAAIRFTPKALKDGSNVLVMVILIDDFVHFLDDPEKFG
jgi:hypothetical protein